MILETERLLLREFNGDDWEAVLAYQSDPRYLRFNPWESRTEADVRGFIQMFIDYQAQQPRCKFQLAIIEKSTGLLVGNCGIRKDRFDSREAELGYELNPQVWRRGYATEAAGRMVAYGFEELGIHRLWAHCLVENTASAHVLEKLGFRLEGRLRENEWLKGRWWDSFMYGMLVDEYHDRTGKVKG